MATDLAHTVLPFGGTGGIRQNGGRNPAHSCTGLLKSHIPFRYPAVGLEVKRVEIAGGCVEHHLLGLCKFVVCISNFVGLMLSVVVATTNECTTTTNPSRTANRLPRKHDATG